MSRHCRSVRRMTRSRGKQQAAKRAQALSAVRVLEWAKAVVAPAQAASVRQPRFSHPSYPKPHRPVPERPAPSLRIRPTSRTTVVVLCPRWIRHRAGVSMKDACLLLIRFKRNHFCRSSATRQEMSGNGFGLFATECGMNIAAIKKPDGDLSGFSKRCRRRKLCLGSPEVLEV